MNGLVKMLGTRVDHLSLILETRYERSNRLLQVVLLTSANATASHKQMNSKLFKVQL